MPRKIKKTNTTSKFRIIEMIRLLSPKKRLRHRRVIQQRRLETQVEAEFCNCDFTT